MYTVPYMPPARSILYTFGCKCLSVRIGDDKRRLVSVPGGSSARHTRPHRRRGQPRLGLGEDGLGDRCGLGGGHGGLGRGRGSLVRHCALAALALSFGIALYLRFSAGRIATLIHGLSLFPLFVPSIIISYALVRFLGPNGLFQLLLEQVGFTHYRTPYLTPVGPFLAFVWENIPLPVLVLSAGLSQVSDHAVEAARDLGAKAPRILFEILLPQMRRSLLIAFALIFMGIIGAFTVPYMLGPPAPEMMSVFMQRTLGNLHDPNPLKCRRWC